MEVIQHIVEACFWILGTFWATISALFWIFIGLVVATFVAFLFRRRSSDVTQVDPVVAVREALRRGALDADIARVEQRNRQRGNLQ